MKIHVYIDRINLINKLISQSKTGNQVELAKRLRISVSRLARIIEYMKEHGAPIKFDKTRKTYYYYEKYSIHIYVKVEKLNINELTNINAGEIFPAPKNINAFFMH